MTRLEAEGMLLVHETLLLDTIETIQDRGADVPDWMFGFLLGTGLGIRAIGKVKKLHPDSEEIVE